MTPEEAVHHEWLQPSSSSSTFIITSSTSASSLMKHSRDQLKENDSNQQQIIQKYQRSQPITPLTILPQIKTPSNRISQRYNNNSNTINATKESSRAKGKKMMINLSNHCRALKNQFLQFWQHLQVTWTQHNNRSSIKCINSRIFESSQRPLTIITQCSTQQSRILLLHLHLHWLVGRESMECRIHKALVMCQQSSGEHDT